MLEVNKRDKDYTTTRLGLLHQQKQKLKKLSLAADKKTNHPSLLEQVKNSR